MKGNGSPCGCDSLHFRCCDRRTAGPEALRGPLPPPPGKSPGECDFPGLANATGLFSCSFALHPRQIGLGPSQDGKLLVGDHNQLTSKPPVLELCGCTRAQLPHASLFVTSWTVAPQAPLSMGFSRQEHRSGFPCPPPGELPNPEIELRSPAPQTDSLPLSYWGSPLRLNTQIKRCSSPRKLVI